jgi:glycosyltransferase involved in cell wall biosynthesis
MVSLSAVIITFNEQRNIGRCIDSLLAVADEIVVLDSLSTDQTASICKQYPQVRFHTQPFLGHIAQKNAAVSLANNDWVLSLDADEELSPELISSILQMKSDPQADGYSMNRLTSYCGKWIRHCGWYPDRKIRLFHRSKGRWSGVDPHDKYTLDSDARLSHLKGDILHYSYVEPSELRTQTEKFARIGGDALFKSGKGSKWVKMFFSPMFRFIRAYVLKLGFLDGRAGLIISWYSAKECFLKYNHLRRLVYNLKP